MLECGPLYTFETVSLAKYVQSVDCEPISEEFADGFGRFVTPLLPILSPVGQERCQVLCCRDRHGGNQKAFFVFDVHWGTAELHALYVDPEARSKGLGLACLRHVTGIVVGQGARRISAAFIQPRAWKGRLYRRYVDEVLYLYRPSVKFRLVACDPDDEMPEEERIWEWIL